MAHRMAVIMVSGRNLRMTFKAQFSTASARFLAHQAYRIDEKDISTFQAEDFVREFCNVVAGYVKAIMANNSIVTGVSLPTLARGFDNFFFKTPTAGRVIEDQWKLSCQSAEIFCSNLIEIFGEFQISDQALKVDDSGDVEFL
jgi:CheY-specific phosphatase CheX